MYDFFYTLRNGLPGVFEGVGEECVLLNDSNYNEDQRFFDLLNGGEYEHAMKPVWYMPFSLSSMLDRLLLWETRGQKPNATFVSNKYPDQAYFGGDVAGLHGAMTLRHWRMDLAAVCMTSGYAGKDISRIIGGGENITFNYPGAAEQREKYHFPIPPIYDEYHEGTANNFNWMGLPTGGAERISAHLGPVLYRFDKTSTPPTMHAEKNWQAGSVNHSDREFTLGVRKVGLWLTDKDSWHCRGELPLGNIPFEKEEEYTVRFTIKGSNPWKQLNPRYGNIPKNIRIRFCIDGTDEVEFKHFTASYIQEALVFEEERECILTLKAPASGTGSLQIDLSENTGETTIGNLEIRKGCGDVFYRKFENGLVIFNGSFIDPVRVDLATLFPSESYSRIKGTQDPAHNNGKLIKNSLAIPPHDAFFLRRNRKAEKSAL